MNKEIFFIFNEIKFPFQGQDYISIVQILWSVVKVKSTYPFGGVEFTFTIEALN